MVDKVRALFSTKSGEALYRRICDYLRSHGIAEKLTEGVLLGLSGGADSVFLAAFLYEYRTRSSSAINVHALHVNHMIRGTEADRDEAFSKRVAEQLGFTFESVRIDVPALSKELGTGCEETARNARYQIFADIIRGRSDLSCVATAHNSTDNVETIIFNLARGTGTKGACGIAPIKGNVLRPILPVTKDEIRDLLCEHEIEFMCDSTNDSVEYTRNYIRHEILPRLAHINPKFETSFANFASSLRDDIDFIDSKLETELSRANSERVSREYLLSLSSSALTRFLAAFAEFNGAGTLEHSHISAIRALLCEDNFTVSVTGRDFICERGSCYFKNKGAVREEELYVPISYGENHIPGYRAVIHLHDGSFNVSSSNVYKISIQADISSAIINGSLYVRLRREGDAYFYGGMTHKLKKVFNDRDIPPSRRGRIPVICDDSGIVWVPGLGVRDDSQKGNNKRMFISFSVLQDGEGEELYTALKGT